MLDKIRAIVQHAKAHSEECYPFECCGLIDQDMIPYRCVNIAKNRRSSFRVSETDVKRITRSGSIAGIYHSHCDDRVYLSKADLEGFGSGLHVVVSCLKGVAVDVAVFTNNNGLLSLEHI